MSRIIKSLKSGALVSIIAVVAAYFGASVAMNQAWKLSKVGGQQTVYQLVDDPVPCNQC